MNKENWPTLNAGVRWSSGVLADVDILAAIANNQLVQSGDVVQAKYATYELVIGTRIEELVMDNEGGPQNDLYRAKVIADDGIIVIMPGQTFKVFAREVLNMPCDITAFAIPVGNMYKLGLNPETTFADPGFAGPFFVTVCNYSPRIVKLKVGDPLARMFFFRLHARPERIHEGPPRETPPAVERVPRPTPAEMVNDVAVIQAVLAKVDPPHYQHAFVTNRIIGRHQTDIESRLQSLRSELKVIRWVVVATGCVVTAVLAISIWRWASGTAPSFSEGVLSSIVAAVIGGATVFGFTRSRTWADGHDENAL